MARTKVTGRGRGRGGLRLVIGGVAHFIHLPEIDKPRVLLLLLQEKEKLANLQQQLAHAQQRLVAAERREAEAKLRLASVAEAEWLARRRLRTGGVLLYRCMKIF